MNSKVYRGCAVPQCNNTSIKHLISYLYSFHKENDTRQVAKTCKAGCNRDIAYCSPLFCEDHFDLPNDMENYMEYHVMGSVSQVRMKPACMPSKFQCQPDRRKRTFNATKRPYILKKQRLTLIKECEKDLEERSVTTKQVEVGESSSGISVSQAHIENTSQKDSHKSADKATQVLITYKYRSKAIQTEVNLVNQMTSPLKPFNQSVSTSPFKIKSCITAKPSTSMIQKYSRKLFTIEEESDSDISFAPSSTHRESSPSTISQQMKSTSDCSELIEEDKNKKHQNSGIHFAKNNKNPRFYIGYGGRITDTCLVEQCDFIRCLQPGMYVMADRGFKHVEQYLRKEGVQLVRPPSVTTGAKLSKSEVRETKQIASLRIHVERVIRRLREFNMLKPHACVNHNLVKVLDDVITIACGLVNIQDSLIK
ncbi:hypothetical protein EVAR_102684_1 [Eumeta japonica]|uniref:DDE Tnp4 domain-containing protein n=1 Tax=Eumeta variegata TaxID=151549 RepID=A0A4C1SLW1_EUMVA|nr:hypothetical protein EVAR_102684_1 [Eumeta japonica]